MDGLDVQNTVFYVYVLLMHVDILANLLGSSGNIKAQIVSSSLPRFINDSADCRAVQGCVISEG